MFADFLSKVLEGGSLLLFIVALFLVIFAVIGVTQGNVVVLSLLRRLGFVLHAMKPDKDFKLYKKDTPDIHAWITIPSVCHAPVLLGDYKKKDYKGREYSNGELHIVSSGRQSYLYTLANDAITSPLKDLTIISGRSVKRSQNLRRTQFTFIDRYVKTGLKLENPYILIYDGSETLKFKLAFFVHLGVEDKDKGSVTMENREDFILNMRKIATYDSGLKIGDHCVILSANMGIDTMLVFLTKEVG